ncbi:MAG: small multi-drug export protein [Anaerolineae bacterium]|nr:small multi-drug export protein [Anaerolineae bacterium]
MTQEPPTAKTALWLWIAIGFGLTSIGFVILYALTHQTHGMGIVEYGGKSFISWFMGFFPMFEIYGAVPASYALGLGVISSIIWAVFGNILPVFVIHYGYEYLSRYPRIGAWLERLASEKMKQRMNRYGTIGVLILTPWVGIWAMAITARALGMTVSRLFLFSGISVTAYAVVIATTMDLGVKAISGG